MARFIEITLWVVFVGALAWLVAARAWLLLRPRATKLALGLLISVIGTVRPLLKALSFDLRRTTGTLSGGVSLDDLAAAVVKHLEAEHAEAPTLAPQQGLISWNIPKTLPTGRWRDVQVRVSRGRVPIADHRAGLKGGPPAYSRTITVGTRVAVRLHSKDANLQIDDLQVDANTNARERDLPQREPRHWDFRIRSDEKGWRELNLIATPIEPALDDQFIHPHAIEMTRTRLGAWHRALPFDIKGAMWAAVGALVGLVGIGEIAKPYVQEPVRTAIERMFGPPPGSSKAQPSDSPDARGEGSSATDRSN